MSWHIVIDVLRNSVLITGLVLIMMLMIEYFNIHSHGRWFSLIKNSKIKQIFLGSLLGLVPGCIGGFATVSLYTHRLLSLGALVAPDRDPDREDPGSNGGTGSGGGRR